MNSTTTADKLRNEFFEKHASVWDSRIHPDDHNAVERIFNKVKFNSADSVLDVGSGTGITIPYYENHGISKIYACDSCPGMVEILRSKFPGLKIFRQSYLEPVRLPEPVDKIVIFNTFPHFSKFEPVFRNSKQYLKRGGYLIIAHSMSRLKLNICHRSKSFGVENDIMPDEDYFRKMLHRYNFSKVIVEDSEKGFFASGQLCL